MSFAQIHRVFEAYKLNDEEWLRKFRLIAFEVWRKGAKNAPEIDVYMPVGKVKEYAMTEEDLDDVWKKYGKLDLSKKTVKLRRN